MPVNWFRVSDWRVCIKTF